VNVQAGKRVDPTLDAQGQPASAGRRVQRATLTEQIEDSVRSDIIAGVLKPGQRLAPLELAERYGVSATPLREAVQRLAADSLVQIDPRLGATVTPISRSHLRDTYRIRELIESWALAESIANSDAAWEASLRQLFGEFQVAVALSRTSNAAHVLSWSQAHRAFHDGLLAACDSPWAKDLLNLLNNHTERYRMLSAQFGVRDPIGEHATIFAAAVRRDAPAACEALRNHLQRTVDVIEESVDLGDVAAQPQTGQG
jgi:GntR family carbon starvation induced transcriptional regulator